MEGLCRTRIGRSMYVGGESKVYVLKKLYLKNLIRRFLPPYIILLDILSLRIFTKDES